MLSLKPRPFVQSFFDTRSYLITVCAFLFVFFCVSLEMSHFPSILVPLPVSLCMDEYVVRFFPFRVVFFLPSDHRMDFRHQLFMREFNQIKINDK